MKLAEIYELESQICKAMQEGHADHIGRLYNEMYEKMESDERTRFLDANIFNDVLKTKISAHVISQVFNCELNAGYEEIDGKENECKSYVEQLLDVDLSNVKILRQKMPNKFTEGFALPCGKTNHLVVLPPSNGDLPPSNGDFISRDLLIHELAHTAEYTLRRANDEIEMIRSHPIFSEAIAHYCQFKYLLDFGTELQRIYVTGSVTLHHLSLRALVATIELVGNTNEKFDVQRILTHKALAEYSNVYPEAGIRKILAPYNNNPLHILYKPAEYRMGAILALHFINNGLEIRKLCTVKTDGTASELLERLGMNAEELLNFSQADSLLKKFIDGKM